MTTPNEREARELLAQHCECGGTMQYTKTDDCIRAIIAALTREQREAQPEAPGAVAFEMRVKEDGWEGTLGEWRARHRPPAPVDVRKHFTRAAKCMRKAERAMQRAIAALDGQQAGVDRD
jgi:hypothetical protein